MKRVSKIVVNIYGWVIWIAAVFIVTGAGTVALPKLFGVIPYVILSSSMEPSISTGSLVFVNTKDKDAEPGDIISFEIENGNSVITVTHRVTEVTENGYLTKGDNNDISDSSVISKDQVIGIYTGHLKYVGYLWEKLDKKTILIVIAWMIGLTLLWGVLAVMVEDDEEEEKICGK